MSDELLNIAYSVAHQRKNELWNTLCNFPSSIIQSEIDKLERLQSRIVDQLGYFPAS